MPKKEKTLRPLFSDFTPASYDDWHQAAVDSLKGKPFEKLIHTTYDGIELKPIYRQEDSADFSAKETLPGEFPYLRGTEPVHPPWQIAQAIPYPTPQALNDALRHDLGRGQTAIHLKLDAPSRRGTDPTPENRAQVGVDGTSIAAVTDLETAFADLDLSEIPVLVDGASPAMAALLLAWAQKHTVKLSGSVGLDPLGSLAAHGEANIDYDILAALTKHAEGVGTVVVDVTAYQNAGANTVQQVAYALATGAEYIRALQERGLDVNTIATRMRFVVGIGANLFAEVAKFRALRMLWAQVVEAFGGDAEAQKINLYAHTGMLDKSELDPYVNMLRTTVEAFAGAVSGIDGMHIAPFDATARPPDAFSRRIARNQHLVLQQEANLARLVDPAGGSWYVEYLTQEITKAAWAIFQQIEAASGMHEALQAETPQEQTAEVAEKRVQNLANRRDVMVGTNMYANPTETPLRPDDGEKHAQHRIDTIAQQRGAAGDALAQIKRDDFDTLVQAALYGATLGEITSALYDDQTATKVTPLCVFRLSEPFEALRQAARGYTEREGHPPQIFLANVGSIKQYKARADFTTGFFEVGGFEIVNEGGFETPKAAAKAAVASGAGAVVICSTDDNYSEIVAPLVDRVKAEKPEMVVILAGYPQKQIDAYKAAGVDAFIHLRADCYAINRGLQKRLGVSDE